ncbi:MAG: DNA topoisomerase 3 [Bacteroidales bacterium]|nr:DNA topoisomerase 3 [Bacteroidales bacterium]
MIVCIAEKPSVAREIAAVLGATRRCDGYLEGNGYQVTWTFGHLCMLKEPHDYDIRWKQWNSYTLPIFPTHSGIKLIENDTYKKQFSVIQTLFASADEIVNCGDAGQEGELIQRWVLLMSGARCPVKRLWISSLTEEAIRQGFAELRPQSDYQLLYEAALARSVGDWLLGINATRAYTIRYGRRGSVLSVGRVQTPTLAMIVERQKEIENFESKPYWELKTDYREVTFSAVKGKFQTPEEGQELLKKIEGQPFTVTNVTKKTGKEAPPRLFDLTSLQVECNKKYALSADDTLKTAQSLYEKKLLTYPRVDTTYLPDDLYPKIAPTLKNLQNYAELTAPLLAKPILKLKRVFDNSKITDHHAIIPTGVQSNALTAVEQQVYDMVVRRFIANFYPDSIVATTTLEGESVGVGFKTSGKTVIEPTWRVVFGKQEQPTEDKEEIKTLPPMEKGESGPHKPSLVEKHTQPPKPFTEATLLRAMETAGKNVDDETLRDAMKENGIGRPSTRAAIIETLITRKYIRKERKNLVATELGVQLIDLIHDPLIKSVELTGQWEKKLRDIEKNKVKATDFITDLKAMVTQVVQNVKNDTTTKRLAVEPDIVKTLTKKAAAKKAEKKSKPQLPVEGKACPKCGKGIIVKGHTAWGCSRWKEGCDWRVMFPKEENIKQS